MANHNHHRNAKLRVALLTIFFLAVLALGYVTIWVSLHMAQTPTIRVIIAAIGPVWAILTIFIVADRSSYLQLLNGMNRRRKKENMNWEVSFNDEYMELKNKYPLAIHRHEQHCRHHHIGVDEMIDMALSTSEEEWKEREAFRKAAREERLNREK